MTSKLVYTLEHARGGGGGGELEGGVGDLHVNLTFHMIAFIPLITWGHHFSIQKDLFSNDYQLLFDSLMSFNSCKYNGAELK